MVSFEDGKSPKGLILEVDDDDDDDDDDDGGGGGLTYCIIFLYFVNG
jgi:hypothetical protein